MLSGNIALVLREQPQKKPRLLCRPDKMQHAVITMQLVDAQCRQQAISSGDNTHFQKCVSERDPSLSNRSQSSSRWLARARNRCLLQPCWRRWVLPPVSKARSSRAILAPSDELLPLRLGPRAGSTLPGGRRQRVALR